MDLKEFLGEFGEPLREKINLCPVYDPDNLDKWDTETMERLNVLNRTPFKAQTTGIMALAKGFYKEGKRAEILVGEMGVGKTFCATAVPALNRKKNHRTLVMGPGHLVEKWMREIREAIPHAKIINLNNPGLKELFALKGTKARGMEFYVIGKERARNHYAWKPAVIMREDSPYCPQCGMAIDLDEMRADFTKSKVKCPSCSSPLWQADREGPRRFAKAEYIKRYLPKGIFDLCIADEVHEYKGGDTAQGQALACLTASARQTIALTGTLMGGYATNLFYLFWRMFPELMADKAPYGAEKTFAGKYGVLEFLRKERLRDNAQSLGGQKSKELVKEKPGVSPLLLPDFLLENAVFLRLGDVSDKLPSYTEEIVGVQMLAEQEEAYAGLEDDLREECSKAVARGDLSLLGALINSLLGYPDGCRRGETVRHPRTGEFIAGAPAIETDLLPKEEKLLELVQSEVAQGRKCMICLEHTGRRDLIPTLVERLEKIGISPLVLRADNPPVAKRESYIKSLACYHDVMIANTNLIKTGLDLIEFPTLIFFQTGYSVYTLRQASRRSWRIGQTKPVKVYYLSYLNTMQEKALALIASKLETALAVEGELSDKGLAAIAESGSSMIIELARALIDKQDVPSLEAAWQGYKQQSVIVDARLESSEKPEEQAVAVDEVETVTETTATTKITQGKQETKVEISRVVQGKVYLNPKEGIGIAFVGPRRQKMVFQEGRVFYNNQPVGEYDRSGTGQINGKPIELRKDGNVFLVVELVPTAQSAVAITETKTTMTFTQGKHQGKVAVTRVVRGTVTRKGNVGLAKIGEAEMIFQGGQVFYNNRPVGKYDQRGKGQINGKDIELRKEGNDFLLVELQKAA